MVPFTEPEKNLEALKQVIKEESGATLWYDAMIRLKKNKFAILGLFILLIITFSAIFATYIAPYSY